MANSEQLEPTGLVDIHAHLLPGIDDGPPDLEEALALALAAVDSGVDTLVATPHLRTDFPDVDVHQLKGRCAAIQQAIDREGIGLRVASGAEASLQWALEATSEELQLASCNQRGKDLLVEAPATGVSGLEAMLWELRLRGFRITLAHPERSADSANDRAVLERLAGQGILLQVNADALVRGRRTSAGRLAEWLCKEGLAHVLASDGHRAASWRPVTMLADALDELAALVGEPRARWMTVSVPAAIVAGNTLPAAPEIKRRRFLARWH